MAKRILLCDDEPHILRAAQFKFERADYQVRCAGDGEEAWRLIEEECPDVLVTDCQMPRLDGLGLIERIRSSPRHADLPVMMLTAKGFELPTESLCESLRVLAILAKPFSPRDLLERVERVLAPPCQERAAPAQAARG